MKAIQKDMTILDDDDDLAHVLLGELVEIRITTRDLPEARALARMLVKKRLAAGVNLVPGVESVYRWKDEICEHSECLLLVQTTQDCLVALHKAVRAMHSYELPMITAVKFVAADEAFSLWVHDNTHAETDTTTDPSY